MDYTWTEETPGQQQQNYRYSSQKNLIEMLLKLLIGEIDAKLLKTAKIHQKNNINLFIYL